MRFEGWMVLGAVLYAFPGLRYSEVLGSKIHYRKHLFSIMMETR